MKKIYALFSLLLLFAAILFACATTDEVYTPLGPHPEDIAEMLGRRQICTDCHTTESDTIVYERYNHTPYFTDNHGPQARLGVKVCAMCHQQSFCNECHATYVELKPSIKDQTGNRKKMIHRGDYLSRHQIDGRINPVPCFRCHGNPRSSKTCVRCHG